MSIEALNPVRGAVACRRAEGPVTCQQNEVMCNTSVDEAHGETTLFGEYWCNDHRARIHLTVKVTNKNPGHTAARDLLGIKNSSFN